MATKLSANNSSVNALLPGGTKALKPKRFLTQDWRPSQRNFPENVQDLFEIKILKEFYGSARGQWV